MDFRSILQANSKKAIKTLSLRELSILLSAILPFIFLFFLSSLGNANIENIPPKTIQNTDTDEDGLSDEIEMVLGTAVNDKYGDKDMDGLYDFEEYLDIYGNNDTDSRTYDYNDSTTHGDVLDIYHFFNLSSNKTKHLRDQSFTEANGGFADYLLWNVSFTDQYAGGSFSGNVSYSNNIMRNVSFTAPSAGGSFSGNVNYSNNIMRNVSFTAPSAGGSFSGNVNYSNNIMRNVSFTNTFVGGSLSGDVSYSNNTITNVTFTAPYSGGGSSGDVSYTDNTISNILLSGINASKSQQGVSSYTDNVILDDSYDTDSDDLGDGRELFKSSTNPISNDTDGDDLDDGDEVLNLKTNPTLRDTDGDGLEDGYEVLNLKTNPTLRDTDGDGLNDSYEVLILKTNPTLRDTDGDGLNDSYEVWILKTNPTLRDTDGDGLNDSYEVLILKTNPTLRDTDGDGLNDSYEVLILKTNPTLRDTDGDGLNDSYEVLILKTNPTLNDSDSDGLNDRWEVTYSKAPGVNPLVGVTVSELGSDLDSDGLTLQQEHEANTDPTLEDTDRDGLADGWEVTYKGTSGVNPLVGAKASELRSDLDSDGLTLLEEAKANTDPTLEDTDGDTFADRWEVTYSNTSGVNPLVGVTASELNSDLDSDGLTLQQEHEANTNPTSEDTDGDTFADRWEVTYSNASGVNPLEVATASELNSDLDSDGLTLQQEHEANTNPTSEDTDGDTFADRWEVTYSNASGVNPLEAVTVSELDSDLDSDGLTLQQEHEANTNPTSEDTDGDTFADRWEVSYRYASGVNPLEVATDGELNSDLDGDGLTLSEEAKANTDPTLEDTDDDGLNDSYEWWMLMTDPTLEDTDGDNLDDKWELRYNDTSGVNPLVPATASELASDTDNDGLVLRNEFRANTDPSSNDTDRDSLNDSYEVKLGTDPTLIDTDNDGLNDSYEVELGTDPTLIDTDNDGLNDKWEVEYNGAFGVNPRVAATDSELASDTDNDGLTLQREEQANTDPGTAENPIQKPWWVFPWWVSPLVGLVIAILGIAISIAMGKSHNNKWGK